MDRAGLQAWIALYERAWRTPGTELLAELFAPQATYRTAPFERPFQGLPAIIAMWEATREGPEEAFAMDSAVVAVEGATGVARLEVRYGDPGRQAYRDLWIVRFDAQGRCMAFEEWPFWPPGTKGGWIEGPQRAVPPSP